MSQDEVISGLVKKLTHNKSRLDFSDIEEFLIDLLPCDINDGDEFFSKYDQLERLAKAELLAEHYVEFFPPLYVYIGPSTDTNWYKPENKSNAYFSQIPMPLLIEHLGDRERELVFDQDYLPDRSHKIRKALDEGVDPMSFRPINIHYDNTENEFYVRNGIHRIQVFNEREIPYINAELTLNPAEEQSSKGCLWLLQRSLELFFPQSFNK